MKYALPPKYVALAAATCLLALNFWAWSIISPLAARYAAELSLTPFAVSILVAMPVLVGSLGRIAIGLLADRYGGYKVLVILCLIASVPVAALSVTDTYTPLLAIALGIGIAGASFAAGVPFVSAWFPKNEQGAALGIYAIGNTGTALSGILTPRITAGSGRPATFLAIALWLILAGLLFKVICKESPAWHPATSSVRERLRNAARWPDTWKMAALYVITFGAFVSFGLYLPLLLHTSYGIDSTDAAARAAGFILTATIARPFGGWLSDHIGSANVIRTVLLAVTILATIIACTPSLMPFGTIVYLLLAATLGIGSGSVFARIGHTCSPRLVGSVTGLVGAAGGVGGFLPPILLGFSFQFFHSYAAAVLLLAATCFCIVLGMTASDMRVRSSREVNA